MDTHDHEARVAALRRLLANPKVTGELRTKLERLAAIQTKREVLQGAMAKRDATLPRRICQSEEM